MGSRRNLVIAAVVVSVAASVSAATGAARDRAGALEQPGEGCERTDAGVVRLDGRGRSLQCDAQTQTWKVVDSGTPSVDLDPTKAAKPTATTTPERAPASTAPRAPRGTQPGAPCRTDQEGVRALTESGGLVECGVQAAVLRWVALLPGSSQPSSAASPAPRPATAAAATDALDPQLGNPTGLPPGAVLPPGAALLPGSPHKLASNDWWKAARWRNEAVIASSTDLDAVHTWFVSQCGALGWHHDPARDERLPSDPKPAPHFRAGTQMTLGECRTTAGSDSDPSRRRPWYLSWSATVQAGAGQVEVIVELSDRSRVGGLPL